MKDGASVEPSVPAREPSQPGSSTAVWRSEIALCAFLLLLSILPYTNTLSNEFVYDDITQILDNPYILSFRHVGRIFSTPAWSYVRQSELTNYYRPMMTFGYLVCYQLFGSQPYGFHLANIIFHALVVLVLYFLTRRLFASQAVAFLASGLFALHPIHSESVDWVAAVTDLEVTLFLLLTFWFFLRAAKTEGKTSWPLILGMAVSFLLALCSKEQALMFPLLATVYEHLYRDDRGQTRAVQKIARYSGLWILSFAYLLFRIHMFGAFAPATGNPNMTRQSAIISSAALAGQYIWKLIWPVKLSAFYIFSPSTGVLDPGVLAGLAALAGSAVLFAILWKRARIVSFGLVWFFATLAPVLNARMLASDNVFAERYLYLPSIGFCWLTALGGVRLWDGIGSRSKFARVALVGSFGILAILYAARIITRNRVWRDEFTLGTVTLETSPTAVVLYNNLGSVYWNRGDVDSAARVWEKALTLAPRSATVLNNLGLVYSKRGNLPISVDYFTRAIAAEPNFPDSHLNLGVAYETMGLRDQAEAQFQTAISLAPLNIHAHNRLGNLYLDEQRYAEAEKQFSVSASIAPNVVAYDALGKLLMQRNDRPAAEEMFLRSIALNPADTGARLALAELYVADGRIAEAFEQYREVLKIDPQNFDARQAFEKLSKTHDPPH